MAFWWVLLGCNSQDYQVFQVASELPTLSGDCEGASGDSTLKLGSTLILFAGPADAWFADMGGYVLEGARDGGVYAFAGEVTDESRYGPATVELEDEITLDVQVNGRFVTGTYDEDAVYTCTEGSVGDCQGLDSSCGVHASFSGVRVGDDVDRNGAFGTLEAAY